MKIFLILATLWTSTYSTRITCNACFNTVCYSRDTILKGNKYPGQIAIDRISNIVYFHYQNKKSIDLTGAFDINNIKFQTISNMGFTFGHAVNQENGDLYASGAQGIYKHNRINNKTELYGLKDKTIWRMQYKNQLYYTEFRQKGLNVFTNNRIKEITELSDYQIDDFVIDYNNNIYFISNNAVYVYKMDTKKVDLFENEIYALATDKNEEVYLVQSFTRGVYKVNSKTGKKEEVGAFGKGSPVELVFDSDNHLIYFDAVDSKLYYLSPTMNKCSVATRGFGKKNRKFVAVMYKTPKVVGDNLMPMQTKEETGIIN